ncbi:MAG: lipopolysaccharide biosynthesis protein [Rhodanobacter sp.]
MPTTASPETATRGLLTGSATYLISNILRASIPFALLPILTRYLGPTQYGQVAMFQTLVAALAAVVGLSTHGSANRKFYDADITHDSMGHFVGACLQILAATGVLVFIIVFLLRKPLAGWLGLTVPWTLLAVAVTAAAFVVTTRLGQWQVRGQAVKYGVMQVTQSFADMALSLMLVVVLAQGAAGRINAQACVVILSALLALYLLAKDRLLTWSWRPLYLREAMLFGAPLIPHVAGTFLLNAADRLVINSELGLAQAGIYMTAVQLTMAMAIVFDAINKAYVPWLFERLKRDQPEEKKQIVRWTYLYFGLALAVAAVAFFVGPYAITLIAGTQYTEAGKVIGLLALGQAFGGMYLMVTNYIFYSKRTGLLSMATLCSALVNIALLLLLVDKFGTLGAAWAFMLSMAIRFMLTWGIAQKRHRMPWFPSRSI